MPPLLSRRKAIRQLVLGTAASWLAGSWLPQAVLASTTPVPTTGRLKLRIPQFPVLGATGGSVRLRAGLSHPVAINRGPGNAFYAVSTRCQHLGCVVNAFDPGLNLMRCGCHGSTYHIDGSLAGGPALLGLETFPIAFDGVDGLVVTLPAVSFGAQEIAIESVSEGTRRVRVDFQPELFSTYQIEHRAELTQSAQLVPFSLTPAGAAVESSYLHQNTADPTAPVALYVDVPEPKGFLSIVLAVVEY